ncbi:hypothetical protein [Halomonas alkalisoli]|uniref:hypothetical protein n=1 Tax=Halomonas alkalisoli TaxID=2907158 RepID=UPI001F38714F|nr:hypothetical protein [Halomonas alkalisoli]MCE9682656.1 hypothetical protein [Halomonas alkalisoli]
MMFHSSRPWLQRLSGFLFDTSMPRLVQEMLREAEPTLQAMVRDLNTPMTPAFEREVARTLNRDASEDLIPVETLMPPMMERFDLTADNFGPEERTLFGEMQTVCNRCPVVGRCWRAMRADAGWERCRAFCPNADAFEQKAVTAG